MRFKTFVVGIYLRIKENKGCIMKFVINGKFLTRMLSGQERFAYELISELDRIVPADFIEIVAPKSVKKLPRYKNIKVKIYGDMTPILWEQTAYPYYLWKHGYIGINLCTTCPIIKPDITVIHDICQVVNKNFIQNIYAALSYVYYATMRRSVLCFSNIILTVSKFSKKEIVKHYGFPKEKIHVLGNGWQHINRIEDNSTILTKYPRIIPHEYFLAASSLTPQKNFRWIREVAKRNPDKQFVISGKKVGLTTKDDSETGRDEKNILYLGYTSDADLKCLMKNCKAFIHPAIYEGFGIPPLEALSQGAKVIVSNRASLPEIFQQSAYYIDPYNYDVDLDKLLKKNVSPPDDILQYFSWKTFAKKLYVILLKYNN